MMCLACEQEAMWFAYLRRKGLITPDGYLVEQPPSLLDPVETSPTPQAQPEKNVSERADEKSGFSCDDPAAQ
jgi:hypothetical protein